MEVLDRIKYDGDTNNTQWLIYKYPSERIVWGSQLIVNQGQEALLFKGGEALDLFGPGTYTLSTANLPVLNRLVDFAFGNKTPFPAEVYYINKTVCLNLKWGTSTPIPLEDPKNGLVLRVGARGQYGICIVDSRLFVSRIIGALPNGTTASKTVIPIYFKGLINSKIKSVAAQYMRDISFLEITQFLSELSDRFRDAVNEEFERFGIEVVNFYCESIAPPPGDYGVYKKNKENLALGAEFYMMNRCFDIYEKLAESPSAVGDSVSANINQSLNAFNLAQTINCPKCNSKNSPSMKFCGECGAELGCNKVCRYCNASIPAGKYCFNCGKKL